MFLTKKWSILMRKWRKKKVELGKFDEQFGNF